MSEFKNPSVVEFSVFRGAAGLLCSNLINSGRMLIAIFLLLKLPHVSASAEEDTTMRIVLHSVGMGHLSRGWVYWTW